MTDPCNVTAYILDMMQSRPEIPFISIGLEDGSNFGALYAPLYACLCLRLCYLYASLFLLSLCLRCYDEVKGTQDTKIYAHSDSLILSTPLSMSLSLPLSLVLVVMI